MAPADVDYDMESQHLHVVLEVAPPILRDLIAETLIAGGIDVVAIDGRGGEHFDVAIVSPNFLPRDVTADLTVTLPPDGDDSALASVASELSHAQIPLGSAKDLARLIQLIH